MKNMNIENIVKLYSYHED